MIKHTTSKTAIAAILSLTVTYPASAAVPNTFTAGQAASAADVNANFTDLDGRVGALEAASVNPVAVAINCGTNADALKNANIKGDTTYNITGACNGPIYVEDDNVHLLGSDNTADSIVLPTGLNNESAVFAGGAHNLKITNLFLDLTGVNANDQTAGIWARDSFVRIADSRIVGGSMGINPFRAAIVRLDGTNSITEFSKSGLSASDQSNINTRGQTTVTSTRVDDQYMKGVVARNSSSIDIRAGITISVPTDTDARAVFSEFNASVHIRNSGDVSISGDVRSDQNSSIKIEKGTIAGNIDVRGSSNLSMNNGIVITGDARVRESKWTVYGGGSVTGNIDIRRSSSLSMEDGVVITGNARVDSAHWTMEDGSITGTIRAGKGGEISFYNVTQTSDDDRAIDLSSNSMFSADASNLGRFVAYANSTIELSAYESGSVSIVKGGELHLGSVGSFSNTSITEDIAMFPSSAGHLTGASNLNGNNVYGCSTSSYVDGNTVTGIANFATAASDCQ